MIAKSHTSACAYTMLERYLNLASIDLKSTDFLFKPMVKTKGTFKRIRKEKSLSYTRARECIIQKLKSAAPELYIGTHSLRAGGITTAANKDNISES